MSKIYLAGAMEAYKGTFKAYNWRKDVCNTIQEYFGYLHKCINPLDYFNFEKDESKSDREVFNFDLRKVKNADILLVNLDDIRKSIGTCIECYEAYKSDIPVIGFLSEEIGTEDELKQIIHPWIYCCFDRIETGKNSMENAINYIVEYYLTK